MRLLPIVVATAGLAAAAPAAADITVTVEVPRLAVAAYHRPYVVIWLEGPDQNVARTLSVWYQQGEGRGGDGKDWLRDMRTWWRKGGRELTLPADGVSGATRAPGRHTVRIPSARLRGLSGQYNLVVETARELGGRETVRVPVRIGAASTGRASGTTELGAVTVAVTR